MTNQLFDRLLAKKPHANGIPQAGETLVGHTIAVVNAAKTIFDEIESAIGDTFGLSETEIHLLRESVLRAALLHDLGKANDQFQGLMRGQNQRQALRHELLSAWLPLWKDELAAWLFSGDETLQDVALTAVLGHHLKAGEASAIDTRPGSGTIRLRCHWGHPNFTECLRKAGTAIGLVGPPFSMSDIEIDLADRPLKLLRGWAFKDLSGKKLVPIAKALLMAADIAGSALPARNNLDIGVWIRGTLGRLCSREELEGIVAQRLGKHTARVFQRNVQNSGRRVTLVRAGCGSGKTMAAYMWAARRANGRKLFFCYPTTGTATEGYRDYIITTGREKVGALLHSRSEVDIERIMVAEHDQPDHDPGLGITALVSWDVPITVCTADTVLGIIQNSRRSLYSSPSFMNAAFVFDEIHQYDRRLWCAIQRFLEMFRGTPVLLMTATLPENRRRQLETLLNGELEEIPGPDDHEKIKRYNITMPRSSLPWDAIERTLDNAGKVLWVCNTVSRCMERGRTAEKRFPGIRVIPYHSRYRYCDRLDRHNEIIDAFQETEPVLAVTTQVCEVSLDISADLLVTDLAPAPSLIQRLGRLNRRATSSSPPRDAIVLEPSSAAPYEQDEVELAREWLGRVAGKAVSQKDLAKAFEDLATTGDETGPCQSEWLDGGKLTGQAPLREAGYTIPVVRREDVDQAKDARTREFVIRHEIPMLLTEVKREIGQWDRIRHAWVAPAGRVDYDDRWGATWARK